MGYFLGIDGGGTKTICVVLNQEAEVVGRGVAGASNYQAIGPELTLLSIEDAIIQAALNWHEAPLQIQGICLGLAGVGRLEDIKILQDLIAQLPDKFAERILWEVSPQSTLICNDCETALMGGVGESVGVVAIAGTGAICYGKNQQGEVKRVSGWGYLLGDEGGGYDIAMRGLKAVLRSYDGRGKSTILTEKFVEFLGLKNPEGLVEVVYRRHWGVKEIAALAVVIGKAVEEGDEVASKILDQAVEELVLGVTVVGEQLFLPAQEYAVVTVGGVWQGMVQFRERFINRLKKVAPAAEVIWPKYEPAVGAGLLALQHACFVKK